MPDSESDLSPSRRRVAQRQRHRRQIQKRALSAGIVAVVVVVAALWFTDTLRIPTDGPTLAGGAESSKRHDAANPPGAPETEPARRPLTPDQPLRLWIGGDSLAGALGPSLGQITAVTGVVQPQYDSRVGSGLMSGDIDWPEHAQEQMDELNPEVAVFIIGTNDANVFDESQAAAYAELTEQMMRVLVGSGREVYWVNAPVMRDDDLEENVLKVDEIQREVAAKVDGVTFVDAHTLFADETGEYQSSLPDETGDRVLMRAGDGIHLTGAGGDHLARAIFTMLDKRWRITQQAVVGQEKKVLVTKGSTQVPGSSGSGSNSSYSNNDSYSSSGSSDENASSDTTTTTPASVTPPPTDPPATTTTAAPPDTTPTSSP